MSIPMILAPLFVQVALTFALLVWMAYARVSALRQRETKFADIALGQRNWPARALQVSNCYDNQFQLPMLFYVLTILALFTKHADYLFVILAWIFVITRFLHAYIHTGTNNVRYRFNAFAAGVVILLIMWVIFAVRILSGLP